MIVKRTFNHNVLLAEDEEQNEVVLMGKGIGYQKKPGERVDERKVRKRFVFDTKGLNEKLSRLFEEVPIQYLELSVSIIEMAQAELKVTFDSNIYIALSDHLAYAINRYRQNEVLRSALLFEIKKFYQREYQAAKKALDMIFYETGIRMEEDEAGFITMHFVNAQQKGENIEQTVKITRMVEDILRITEYHYQLKLDENSLSYSRFVTHITYFARRLFADEMVVDEDEDLYLQIKNRYPSAFTCAEKVKRYVEERWGKSIGKEEMTYFMVHINRVCERHREE